MPSVRYLPTDCFESSVDEASAASLLVLIISRCARRSKLSWQRTLIPSIYREKNCKRHIQNLPDLYAESQLDFVDGLDFLRSDPEFLHEVNSHAIDAGTPPQIYRIKSNVPDTVGGTTPAEFE